MLEHPAQSYAWSTFALDEPDSRGGWSESRPGEWACEVWQSAYGHPARKRTWLYYAGPVAPLEMEWAQEPGTHQCGWFDRAKPTLSKREASATPPAFADALIRLAERARKGGK